ncbi:UDP-N-acetylmuramoyl-tripeptide--D-alanyl-D-alanine ligase [Aridibaculum aurantiacum]|uniref:UDP-N-acetylmuramoyl-tripeptide--D-alanyl-D- alanine ligase n=1 Tax=Aridibaculum aurantiacum TaxID=2810307 RepID=UPI001A9730B4|nr:UDP-N-acetylmuramoyl-tripeptide--D-alanyl-D-alanine ligase [Aridibaculum aurantiacum]
MTISELYEIYLQNPQVQTDTRKLQARDIFFALSGPNFNGNQFALQALEQGASYAVTSEAVDPGNERVIVVDDVLETLQQLAKHHRLQFPIPFIAITGSNGKTTTKELVHTVLASHFTTYTTEGNLNNHIGIPLTLLRIKKDAQLAVVEMGANHQQEIASYCQYVLPTHGIITNCGKAHLEGFGGIEGVRKGKGELFDYLRANGGAAFIYNDYDYLVEMSAGIENIYTYGTMDAAVVGRAMEGNTFLEVQLLDEVSPAIITTKLVGDYNLPNVLCAVAVAKAFEVPMEKVVASIAAYEPTNSRSQMVKRGSNHIILDAYNANPSSLKLAIENLAGIAADHKILMIGGMMELGEESVQEHQAIIDQVKLHNWDKVVLVGGDFGKIIHPYIFFSTATEAREWFQQQDFQNAYILIKGSRSMKMETILK